MMAYCLGVLLIKKDIKKENQNAKLLPSTLMTIVSSLAIITSFYAYFKQKNKSVKRK